MDMKIYGTGNQVGFSFFGQDSIHGCYGVGGCAYVTRTYIDSDRLDLCNNPIIKVKEINWNLIRGLDSGIKNRKSIGFKGEGRYRHQDIFNEITSEKNVSLCAQISYHKGESQLCIDICSVDTIYEHLWSKFSDVMRSVDLIYEIAMDVPISVPVSNTRFEIATYPTILEIYAGACTYTTNVSISFKKKFNREQYDEFRTEMQQRLV